MKNNDFKDEKAAKYWLHYFRREDVPQLSAKELEEESDLIFKSLMEKARPVEPLRVKRLWYPFAGAVAASVVIIASIALLYLRQEKSTPQKNTFVHTKTHDISPGINSATLILADGTGLSLNKAANGKIADQSGVAIYKSSNNTLVYKTNSAKSNNVEFNQVVTARGQQYQVVLPDGSSVWLNAASSVKFPASFASFENRVIELTGEAYFEVTKDKSHPFIVKTANQEVKVLGTHFNVNSYTDEGVTKTTLLEGSVRVSSLQEAIAQQSKAGLADVVLKPGEQSQSTPQAIKVAKADLSESVAWKNGDFIFSNEEFSSILRQVARWYNVEIIDEQGHEGLRLTGTVSRSRNLSEVLKALETAGKVKFEIIGRRVIVSR